MHSKIRSFARCVLFIFGMSWNPVLPASDDQPGSGGEQTQDVNTSKVGIKTQIFLNESQPEIFPESWLKPSIGAAATALSENEYQRSREILDRAMSKYPVRVLNENLKKVYVIGRLEYKGVVTGGTNSRTAVYVANNGKYSSTDIERIFHAEFSSILLRNYAKDFDKDRWKKINPSDFKYGSGGVDAIKQKKASTRIDESLHEAGFLKQYSQSDLENDFNADATQLMIGKSELWDAVEKSPRVKAKMDLALEFYGKIDSAFTREYFLQLRQSETK